MANLRDLTVGIDFSDIDIQSLTLIDRQIDDIEDQLRQMGLRIDDAMSEFGALGATAGSALDEIHDEANAAAAAVNELGNEDATPDGLAEAIAELMALEAAAESALDEIDDEGGQATRQINFLGFSFLAAAGKAALLGVAASGALAAIVAAGAPLLLLVAGLAPGLMAAAGGAAAFGAVAIPVLTDVFEKSSEIAELEQKLADADTAKERIAAQKELAAAMEGVSKEQQFAMKELNNFKSFWGDFTKQFEGPILNAFGTSLHIVQELFKGLEPTITNVADVINELLTSMDQDLSNGGMKEFFDWLATNGAEALMNWATIAGNLINGVWRMFEAFTPIGASIEEKIVSLTDRFVAWSEGLKSSNGFQAFVDYATTNGPVLWQLLSDVWQVIEDIVVAFAPLGTIVLEALGLLMGKLSELTPYLTTVVDEAIKFGTSVVEHWTPIQETVIGLGVAVGSFVAIMKTMQIIGIINTLLAAYRAGTLVATAAQMGLNLAMLANPITWVIAGIAALIAIGVLLYRNWDTVKAKASELWAKTKEVFGGIYEWGKTKLQPVIDFFAGLRDKFNDFKSAITNFKLPGWVSTIGKTLSGAAGKVAGLFNGSHATGLASVPFDGYRAELHRGEAVLTAQQSNALRAAGILGSNGDKPTVDVGPQFIPTTGGGGKTNNNTFAPSITIQVEGGGDNADTIAEKAAEAAKRELEKFWRKMNLAT